MKALRGSVYSAEGRGMPGPSPPAPTSGLGIMGRGASLRRQTSRLSIEEEREPIAGASYSPGSGSSGRRMASGEYGGFGAAPKIVRKVDPTSPPTFIGQSTPTSAAPNVEHPLPHHHASRFYLPPSTVSSASSSPARLPATTGVPSFTQYISSRSRAPVVAPTTTTGFDLSAPASPAPQQHQQLTGNSSGTSFNTATDAEGGGGGDGGASLSASSIEQAPSRGSGYEEEAVGHLELSEEAEESRGRWRAEEETAEADDEGPPASATGVRSRDRTPGATAGFSFRRGGLPYSPSAVPRPGDYFASRERRQGGGVEDVSFMG